MNEDIEVFLVENFPESLKLHGDSKFKTPRCCDEKIPIIVLPECRTEGLSYFNDKTYLQLIFDTEQTTCFDKLTKWLHDKASGKPIFPVLNERDGNFYLRIRIPDEISVINIDGRESSTFKAIIGSIIQCAVEIPLVWENSEQMGISFQLVQCKIIEQKRCMIQNIEEDPPYIPFVSDR